MDTAMRDLERLEERHPDEGSNRKLGTLLMAALATVGLVFAMGMLMGQPSATDEEGQDPLAVLDLAASQPALHLGEDAVQAQVIEVDRQDLTFPSALEEYDPRPEVEAAIAAATAELAYPDPLPPAAALVRPMDPPAPILAQRNLPPSVPAAVAAGPAREALTRTMRTDPLVAAALPPEPGRDRAPAGSQGRYTLQVISYTTPEEAEGFADELRSRGHRAFVVSANIPERGMHYRVRIGPFETMREAESYRQAFESDERMNTFVVRRRDEQQT